MQTTHNCYFIISPLKFFNISQPPDVNISLDILLTKQKLKMEFYKRIVMTILLISICFQKYIKANEQGIYAE